MLILPELRDVSLLSLYVSLYTVYMVCGVLIPCLVTRGLPVAVSGKEDTPLMHRWNQEKPPTWNDPTFTIPNIKESRFTILILCPVLWCFIYGTDYLVITTLSAVNVSTRSGRPRLTSLGIPGESQRSEGAAAATLHRPSFTEQITAWIYRNWSTVNRGLVTGLSGGDGLDFKMLLTLKL